VRSLNSHQQSLSALLNYVLLFSITKCISILSDLFIYLFDYLLYLLIDSNSICILIFVFIVYVMSDDVLLFLSILSCTE